MFKNRSKSKIECERCPPAPIYYRDNLYMIFYSSLLLDHYSEFWYDFIKIIKLKLAGE